MKSPSDSQVVQNTGLTSNQVRRIIREELGAMSASWEVSSGEIDRLISEIAQLD